MSFSIADKKSRFLVPFRYHFECARYGRHTAKNNKNKKMFTFSYFSQVPDDVDCIAPVHLLRHVQKSLFPAVSMVFVDL